jgi:hypothetical protein
MRRTTQEIIEQADELAARFAAGPDPVAEVPIAEHKLQMAAIARAQAERQVVEAVAGARHDGVSWKKIGKALGTSAQAAQIRYKDVVEAVDNTSRSHRTKGGPGRRFGKAPVSTKRAAPASVTKLPRAGRTGSQDDPAHPPIAD